MEHCLRNPLIMVEACKNGAGDHHEGDNDDLVDSSISSSFSGVSSGSSSIESDSFEEEVTSNPLSDMSSLLQQLPIKRGLSRHYDGKSQSFTSLASVRSLEDLAKHPELRRRRNTNSSNKNLKCCRRIRSYGGGRIMCSSSHSTMNALSRHICKSEWHSSNNSRNTASSSLNFMGTRPPIPPPHRSTTTISTQTPLFV